jgi:hypothetical protein
VRRQGRPRVRGDPSGDSKTCRDARVPASGSWNSTLEIIGFSLRLIAHLVQDVLK